jgi:hypothetical protein
MPGYEHGNFVHPTILAEVPQDMECYKQEICGPVLLCMQANSLQEGIQSVNSKEMGQEYSLDQGQLHTHFNMRFMLAKWELIFQFECPGLSITDWTGCSLKITKKTNSRQPIPAISLSFSKKLRDYTQPILLNIENHGPFLPFPLVF